MSVRLVELPCDGTFSVVIEPSARSDASFVRSHTPAWGLSKTVRATVFRMASDDDCTSPYNLTSPHPIVCPGAGEVTGVSRLA